MMNLETIDAAVRLCQKAMQGLEPHERLAVLAIVAREDGKPGRKRGSKANGKETEQPTLLTEPSE